MSITHQSPGDVRPHTTKPDDPDFHAAILEPGSGSYGPGTLRAMSKAKDSEATDALVIFGITGDLAKKMTFRALYRLEMRGKLDCPIIGVGRNQDWHHETMRKRAEEAIRGSVDEFDLATFRRLAARMRFVNGNFDEEALYQSLNGELADYERPLFYLEIPPPLFSEVVHGLANAGLTTNARVILEKPFGHDYDSAQELQADLLSVLREDQIRPTGHTLSMQPIPEAASVQRAPQHHFRLCVLAPDPGHHPRAGLPVDDIRHLPPGLCVRT